MADFPDTSDAELIELYGRVMNEMQERGIVRSANNPIADIAERIVADYYGVNPEPPNRKSFDIVASDGTTIQVKALRRTKSGRRNLSPLRSLDFDFLVAVLFEADMRPAGALLIPVDIVRSYMRWSKTWMAQCLSVTDRLQEDPQVEWVSALHLLQTSQGNAAGADDGKRSPDFKLRADDE